jgi:hypothetical protein
MGIGNLESVIDAYVGGDGGSAAELVAANDLDYARLFFDSSPLGHADAWDLLASFGDDSSTYLWRVLAAERIMELYRDDRARLRRLARLHAAKATSEEVFHPQEETEAFADPGAIEAALDDGELARIPDGGAYGYEVGDQLGELSRRLGVDRSTYRRSAPRPWPC